MVGEKILFVDDDETKRELFSLLLQATGYEVTAEANFKDAEERVRELNPDLLLLDGMNEGYHANQFLESLLAQDLTIPSVIISGTPVESAVVEAAFYAQRTYTEGQRAALGIPFNERPEEVSLSLDHNRPYFLYKPKATAIIADDVGRVLKVTRKQD